MGANDTISTSRIHSGTATDVINVREVEVFGHLTGLGSLIEDAPQLHVTVSGDADSSIVTGEGIEGEFHPLGESVVAGARGQGIDLGSPTFEEGTTSVGADHDLFASLLGSDDAIHHGTIHTLVTADKELAVGTCGLVIVNDASLGLGHSSVLLLGLVEVIHVQRGDPTTLLIREGADDCILVQAICSTTGRAKACTLVEPGADVSLTGVSSGLHGTLLGLRSSLAILVTSGGVVQDSTGLHLVPGHTLELAHQLLSFEA